MMKRVYLFLLAGIMCVSAQAQQRFLNEVFPNITKASNLVYGWNYSVLTGTPTVDSLRMDVYQPAGSDTMYRRPLIILLHSGSFLPPYINTQLDGGRNDSGIVWMAQSFAKRGYVVANINYRLGWNAGGSNVDIRKGTLIQAFVRAIQDVKACARYFRKDANTNNIYRIDSTRVIVGGAATGGALAVNYAALLTQSQLNIPKFISNITNSTYGFTTGQPYVDASKMGDLDGYGGTAGLNNPNNSPGYNGKPNFVFSFEAIVGDSSWIIPGLPPMVAFHRVNNTQNQPYGNGIVYVNIGGPQPVVEVSGSGVFMPLTVSKGNNNCFAHADSVLTDPYTTRAKSLNNGVRGLFPLMDSFARATWYDSIASITECQQYGKTLTECRTIYASYRKPSDKATGLLYLDTVMGYLNPRIVECLGLKSIGGGVGVQTPGSAGSEVSIYPNPSGGEITINGRTAGNIHTVIVRDITGKTIRQISDLNSASLTLRLNGAAAGLYIVTVVTDKSISSHRLVVRQ